MQNLSFYHIALSVSDLETMANWYEKVLGFKRITQTFPFGNTSKYCFLALNRFKLELVENKLSQPFKRENPPAHSLLLGCTHFSFKVDDLTTAINKMKENKVDIVIEDFTVTDIKNRIMMVRDPDGNLVEFIEEI